MPALPRDLLRKLHEDLCEFGFRETAERSGLWAAQRLLSSMLHRHSRPSLADFAETAASMHFSAEDLVETYLAPKYGNADLSQLKCEYEMLCTELAARYGERRLAYPEYYALERGSAFLLYAFVRALRPSVVLETGVANGHSSFFILSALRANGHGLLHSVDRSPGVGSLLGAEERERWRLHVLQRKGLKRSFMEILEPLQPIGFFLHDSDHTYPWQSFELQAAAKKLAPGGVLTSDDCDGCNAFLDFCRGAGVRPVILVETRKVFGLVFSEPTAENDSDKEGQPSLVRHRLLVRA